MVYSWPVYSAGFRIILSAIFSGSPAVSPRFLTHGHKGWPTAGHRVGPRWRRWQALHRAGATRDGGIAEEGRCHRGVQDVGERPGQDQPPTRISQDHPGSSKDGEKLIKTWQTVATCLYSRQSYDIAIDYRYLRLFWCLMVVVKFNDVHYLSTHIHLHVNYLQITASDGSDASDGCYWSSFPSDDDPSSQAYLNKS